MLSGPARVRVAWGIAYSQSFGANAPPTGGYNKSVLLSEVLTHWYHNDHSTAGLY